MSNRSQSYMAPPPPPPKPHKLYGNGSANGTFTNNDTTTITTAIASNDTTNNKYNNYQNRNTNKINNNNNNSDDSDDRNNSIAATQWQQHTDERHNLNCIANSSGSSQKLNGRNSCHTATFTEREQIVMTPKGKTANSTVILIERKLIDNIGDRVHVAGGDHTGIIINKDTIQGQKSQIDPAQLSLEFRVYLVSGNTGKHSQESRTLRFWFRDWLKLNEESQAHVAQDFFKELVSPKDFPRDYVGFIKKIMKLLQKSYDEIQSLEIELRILEETTEPPTRPLSIDDSQFESPPLTQEKVLELIEQAYPNPITPEDLAKDYGWDERNVILVFISLKERGLIKPMEFNSYTRIHHEDKEIKVVKQMPTISSNKQPTIAIITAQYCEKLAVDAMLENKETFVRYTTVGESNVYTLGNIGAHRIVSTKLPSVGSTREAMTATGNTTTRLLGTFQMVDYVFVVGVAGGVPHYTDYKKHVRLGDVVISYVDKQKALNVSSQKPYVYIYKTGDDVKKYFPINDSLQQIAEGLYNNMIGKRPWETYLKEGLQLLMRKTESDFNRPAANTDKLFMHIGNNEVIEVSHPMGADSVDAGGIPRVRLHLGPIGSGRDFVRNDNLRLEFAKKYDLLATDVEMSSVLDSIIGNCRESFILVKGISDYKDGTTTRKWQNFASLAAASVVKSIICGMDAPTNV